MLLYIHVPFCRKKCGYCAFYSRPLERGAEGQKALSGYLSTLLKELALWGGRLGKTPVETVFFGGGTPSLLPPKALRGILERVGQTFALAPLAEITAEANPESALDEGWLFEARRAGVNRLSLGVQSLNDGDLALLGRVHTAREAEAAFATARAAGFTNISLDLMWGLPGKNAGQSQVQWLHQLRTAIRLQPEHISAYGLTLEPDSNLEKAHARGEVILPPEKELASMYLAGAEFLEASGYMQYEISNYARMGYECRHNLGYWKGSPYLGLGPAATSTLGGRRWTNPENLRAWTEAVAGGALPAGVEELTPAIRARELLMLRLRMNKGLPLKEWRALTGRSFLTDHSALAALLQKNGLAATRKGHFRLTRTGMLVSNTILEHFFTALDEMEKSEGEFRRGGAPPERFT